MVVPDMSQAVAPYQFTINSAVAEWIAQRRATGSGRTAVEYERTMQSFRHFLADASMDVLPIAAQSEQDVTRHAIDIARAAGMWANTRAPEKGWNGECPIRPGRASLPGDV